MSILSTFCLLATLVYQYDFIPSSGGLDGPFSGYIQMKERVEYADHMLGNDGLGLDSIFDFSITVGPKATTGLPTIPATTYRPDDIVSSYSHGGFSSTPHGRSILNGGWCLFLGDVPETYISVYAQEIRTFWPQAYVFNEGRQHGNWKFVGARNVPEAGSTLALLSLGTAALAVFRRRLS